MVRALDAYDHAVAYLTEHPQEILWAWSADAPLHPAHILFRFCTPDGTMRESPFRPGSWCGCLTQVKNTRNFTAWTEALTAEIRNDSRIVTAANIGVENLPAFAEWQRRLDRELGRTPPVWNEPDAEQSPEPVTVSREVRGQVAELV